MWQCCQWLAIKKKCGEESSIEGKEVTNTVVLTFAFQIVFTAFNALQNLHSSLHDEESLGNICLAILYGTAIISSVLSPTIIGLLGAKTVLVCSFAAHSVYVLANFYPSLATMGPAAVALGFFIGPAWTAQALYISASAYSFSKSSSSSPYSILSRFNGFFFAVFATTQIVGNLVTSTVIRDGVGNHTDEMVIFRYCGPEDCPSNENATEIEDPESWVLDITLGFFMGCCLLGLFLIFFLLTPLPRSEWIQRVSVRSTATSCFNVLVSTNMILLVPFIMFTAVEHAFLMSAFTKAYVACPIGIHMVGYVMAAYGATTPIFVFVFTRLSKIAGRFLLLMISMTTHMILLIILYYWSPVYGDEWIIFVIPMVWGVAESILWAQANSLIAMLYPAQKEPAFANFHAWRSVGYTVTFLNASFFCVSTKLIFCMACAGLGTVLYIYVELKTKVKEKLALRQSPTSTAEEDSPDGLFRGESATESMTSNRNSVSSLSSVQDRLSFDPVELADIIKEAQQSWKRSEEGITLEVSKVMSLEHLQKSRVTSLYHTRPPLEDITNSGPDFSGRPSGLSYSFSDGHLVDSRRGGAVKVKMRREQGRANMGSNDKRRPVSENLSPTFESIPEDDNEDGEIVMEKEKVYQTVMATFRNGTSVNGTYVQGDDDVFVCDENLSNIRQKRKKFIRSLSDILHPRRKEYTLGYTPPSESQKSLSSVGEENSGFVPDDGTLQNGRKATFTVGPKSKATKIEMSVSYRRHKSKSQRPASYTQDIRNGSANDTSVVINKTLRRNQSDSNLSASGSKSKPSCKNGKKKSLGFKGFRKSKNSNKDDVTAASVPGDNEAVGNGEEGDNISEADSDGFVEEENEDLENEYLHFYNPHEYEQVRRKSMIPISESEDVTCIY